MGTELGPLLEAVEHFAAKAEPRLFGIEAPDGNLAVIADLVAEAGALGLLADVDPGAGWWGVWGSHVTEEGAGHSLSALRLLGRVCAGLASAVHAQGVAVLLAGITEPAPTLPTGGRLGAGFCPPYGLVLDPRAAGDGLALHEGRLDGIARFALAAGPPDALVLAARDTGRGGERVVLALPVDTPGLTVRETGRRIGLRAATMVDAVAGDVVVPADSVLLTGVRAEGRLRVAVAADWLGQAAIALGCAEQAVAVAREYAATRVQGGAPIIEHAAVRLLLGRADHDAGVVRAVLERHVGSPLTELDPDALLRWAIDARLAAGEHATRAVSDALQALGGYGYMDEYGLSKRLRDVTALRVLHGGPDQLLLARDHRRAAS